MELVCCEGKIVVQRSHPDPVLLKDDRVLNKLLQTEDHFLPRCDYFKIVQKEIKPFMRRLVSTWMFEVCIGIFNRVFAFCDRPCVVEECRGCSSDSQGLVENCDRKNCYAGLI